MEKDEVEDTRSERYNGSQIMQDMESAVKNFYFFHDCVSLRLEAVEERYYNMTCALKDHSSFSVENRL